MRVNPFVYGVVVLALFLGTIGAFKAAGVWSISGKVTASGEAVTADASDVNSIKGWMTLSDVASTFHIPVEEIYQAFNIPSDTEPATALKDLESETFDVTALREWLTARQQGVPAEAPEPAAITATPEPLATSVPAEPIPTVHAAADRTVTGKVTFQQVLDWGVSKDAIEKALGGSMPSPSMIIKDYVTGQGMDFPTIKSALQAEVDQVQ